MFSLLGFAILALHASHVFGACPTVVTRAQWGARAPHSTTHFNNPAHYAFIHHSEAGECNDRNSCAALVRSYQNYHMDTNGWADIGYTFLIGGNGEVFEGRGWDKVGAHTSGYNSVGYGFCFIGNFMSKAPTAAAQQAAKDIIDCGVTNGKIQSSYVLRGHRDMGSTDCPGNTLYSLIKTWPHYT